MLFSHLIVQKQVATSPTTARPISCLYFKAMTSAVSLCLKLDFASAAQTPSTPFGPNILSAMRHMSDEDRAALLRAISEQFSTSFVASTP